METKTDERVARARELGLPTPEDFAPIATTGQVPQRIVISKHEFTFGCYYQISIPDYEGGEVVPAAAYDALAEAARLALAHCQKSHWTGADEVANALHNALEKTK